MWDGSEVIYWTETTIDQNAARRDIEAMVEKAKADMPWAGLSFGYIGNCSRNFDDRCWYVWTKIPIADSDPLSYPQCRRLMVGIGKDFASNVRRVQAFLVDIASSPTV